MRHRLAHRKLNRTKEHRLALRRNMAQNLFERGQVRTTLAKAKDIRPFVERLITLARVAGDKADPSKALPARQRLISILGDRAMIPAEYQEQYELISDAARTKVLRARSGRRHRLGKVTAGQKFTARSIVNYLIDDVVPSLVDRPGGYTRVIRLGKVQGGDSSPMAVLQLVGREASPGTVTRPEKTARQRRSARRYAFAAQALKQRSGTAKPQVTDSEPAAPAAEESGAAPEQS